MVSGGKWVKKSQMSQRSKGQQGMGHGDRVWVSGRLQET